MINDDVIEERLNEVPEAQDVVFLLDNVAPNEVVGSLWKASADLQLTLKVSEENEWSQRPPPAKILI